MNHSLRPHPFNLLWVALATIGLLGWLNVPAPTVDKAGNVSAAQQTTVQVDLTPPTTTHSLTQVLVNGWYSRPLTVTLSAVDLGAGLFQTQYRRNGEPSWQSYGTPFAVTQTGVQVVNYQSTDRALNVESPHTLILPLDLTPPTLDLAVSRPPATGNWYSGQLTVTAQASDSEAGVASLEYTRDGGDWQPYSAPLPFTTGALHTLQLRVTDRVGHQTLSTLLQLGIDTQKMLPEWKQTEPKFKLVHSMVLQDITMRVELAYQAFFRRVKAGEEPGYPRFKGKGRYDSMCFPQYGNGATLDGNKLNLSKIGAIKVELHRELCGKPKTVCIRRASSGKWFVTISCECEAKPLPQEPKAVGIDVGLASFATLSNGEKVDNPRFFRQDEKALAKAQRLLSKEEKGTPTRVKRRKVVSRIHERIANKRNDFAHKLSRQLVNAYGVIVFEDLNIRNMVKNGHLSKSIVDAAWSQLVQYTTYKAVDAGRLCVQVDPRNTSKRCSRCNTIVDKDLSIRIHNCPTCGLVMDRDENAAINILALGLQRINRSDTLSSSKDSSAVLEAHAF